MTTDLIPTNSPFQFTHTGLVISGKPTYDDWQAAWQYLEAIDKATPWILGDMLAYGELSYGEMYSQVLTNHNDPSTHLKPETLQQYKWVAKQWPKERRIWDLSWGYYQASASLDSECQDKVMNDVSTLGMNRQQARVLARTFQSKPLAVLEVFPPSFPSDTIADLQQTNYKQEDVVQKLIEENNRLQSKITEFHRAKFQQASEASMAHVGFNSGDNEWYTPADYIAAAYQVMGSIDLDPASSTVANSVVRASIFYSVDDNGLDKIWTGNIWMNPPYARDLVPKFADKLIYHFLQGDITQAITLTNNSTETIWFQQMAAHASAICLPKGRVQFWHPEKESVPLQGQAILYFGDNHADFIEAFEQFGVVWIRLPKS